MTVSKVETFELAPGLVISRVLNGLWQIADLERDGQALNSETAAMQMEPYVEGGFTTFDMADHYGSSEEIAGYFRNSNPLGSKAQMLTKWVPEPGRLDRQTVRQAVLRAMGRLQTEQIDLLQFHAWHYPDSSWLDGLFWLDELRTEGLIGQIGVTNFDAAHLRMALASGIPIVSNQVSFSLIDQRAAGSLTSLCEEFNVKLLAYGTLAGGFLSEKWLGEPEPTELKTWSQMKYKRFIEAAGGWAKFQKMLAAVAGIANKHGVTAPVVSGRYILDQPAVAGIILGARLGEVNHVLENLSIFDLELDSEDNALIENILKALDPIPGDCGDEYRKPPFLTASGDLSHHLKSIPAVFEPGQNQQGRQQVLSNTSWESLAGYSRAVREGQQIWVSGTTASHGDRLIGGLDVAAQTHFAIDKIEAALESLGGRLEDVVRTRVFVADIDHWEAVARAHGKRFAHIQPANTLVEARLVGEEYLVEIEAEARLNRR
jgi:aryl-alcohol dehydrogenase-like predicted oxidoreductase/enamine deaminase RidA (YjgF/YER057c/UK114 family)